MLRPLEHHATVPTSLLGAPADLDGHSALEITENPKSNFQQTVWASQQRQKIKPISQIDKRSPTGGEFVGIFLITLFLLGLIAVALFSPLQPG
jgi:hypothetical protein